MYSYTYLGISGLDKTDICAEVLFLQGAIYFDFKW